MVAHPTDESHTLVIPPAPAADGAPRRRRPMLYRGELPRRARRTYRGDVSPGAWLTYQAIAARRPLPGGLRQVKRTELAALVCRTPRQVARYLAELRAAGYVEVVAPPPATRRAGMLFDLTPAGAP